MKQTIEEYVGHARANFPNISDDQLIDMVILHFDIPDKEAKEKVEAMYWACWNCGERNHNDFFDCWKCHKPKQKPSFIK